MSGKSSFFKDMFQQKTFHQEAVTELRSYIGLVPTFFRFSQRRQGKYAYIHMVAQYFCIILVTFEEKKSSDLATKSLPKQNKHLIILHLLLIAVW